MGRRHQAWPVVLILAAAFLVAGAATRPAWAAPPEQAPPERPSILDSTEFCLRCHGSPGRLLRLASGEWLGLTVDTSTLAASAHSGTACASCHTLQSTMPHRATPQSRRDLMLMVSAACGQCHNEQHERYDDGVHGISQGLGVSRAATCADCHGGHSVRPLEQWTDSEKAARCGGCHRGANDAFALSGAGHREGGAAYYVERFLLVLTAMVLGFGFLHVELDMLRWAAEKWRGRRSRRRGGR